MEREKLFPILSDLACKLLNQARAYFLEIAFVWEVSMCAWMCVRLWQRRL